MKDYVERLKKYKEDKKISTKELSDISGINIHTLNSWFANKGKKPRHCGKTERLVLEFFEKEKELQALNSISEPCENEKKTIITRKEYDSRWEIVKLETIEEIIDALNNEEVLISDNFLIKIEKGIVVKYDLAMNPLFINPALDFNNNYSVRRKKPVVLAVLKRFKDENGDIWYIYKKDYNFLTYQALNENSEIIKDFNKSGKSLDGDIKLVEEV